ncbi:hypothetical protein FUA23_06925 [Neolewinella aurantiaca]|uniref:Heparinase II/III-like protein n=1 Tax=Neolewinella aurantiaca TaxID=2602767 RepID=A0A5C7FI92_9BACT|nr:hypothetical protein [Neolewinella aurantiaca]TXF90246.1 hypothetical protein FUA23_06925 [Neolewinella aurantiaca]
MPRSILQYIIACITLVVSAGCGTANMGREEVSDPARTQVQSELAEVQRPMIWVRPSERPAILAKIAGNEAVASYYEAFTARVEKDLATWGNDPAAYFQQLPLAREDAAEGSTPPFKTYTSFDGEEREEQTRLHHQLQTAIDCGVLYFLTREERYARYAADVLHNVVQAVRQLPLDSEFFNAGWIYTKDHLREAREIGAQIPIIYDFVQPWLTTGGRVYDLGREERISFDFAAAEAVFRTYAELAINRGGTGTNWPILEASSLVGNALALSDPAERAKYLNYFLKESTSRQDALPAIGSFYDAHGGSWPESLNYSQHVGEFLTYLFTMLSHHDPDLKLVSKYPQVTSALPEAYYLTYPGGEETILFGDGHREYHPMLDGYEMAYHLGLREGNPELLKVFGPLINHSVNNGGYRRFRLPAERSYGAAMYREPTKLLWFAADVPGSAGEYPLPVTAELPFAGITLQRNLSPSGKPEDGLMGFVGGGAYVHGHATGMGMELFGKGFVQGSKGGRTRYRTEIHENYYRIFASNNTVIVNGATTSDNGWVNLGTDKVQRIAAEPEPGENPVSPDFSFTTSSFRDTVGNAAEAYQERTLGIVRTTDSTGFYVDLFRSHSELPGQYHDYIYRNVGDRLYLMDRDGEIDRAATPDRYMANADAEWRQNRVYRQPGWHYFKDVKTSSEYGYDALAVFVADSLGPEPVEMWAHMPLVDKREFTTATSPPLTEGPRAYRKKRSPTLVIRQKGSAWDKPFALLYEPVVGGRNSIDRVETIWPFPVWQGMIVKSNERADEITQYVLLPNDPDEETSYKTHYLDLSFRGRYAVVTIDRSDKLQSIYIGEGKSLQMGAISIRSAEGINMAASIDFSGQEPVVSTSQPLYLSIAGGAEQLFTPK